MAAPRTAIARTDLSLTFSEINLAAQRAGFIGLQVMPPVPVGLQSAEFPKFKAADLLAPIANTRRATRSGYQRRSSEFETDSYSTEDHGIEEIVDDREVEMYGEIDSEAIARDRAVHAVLDRLEQDIADAVFNTTIWSGAALATTASTWSTASSGVPITDIDAAKYKVQDGCGHKANALILSEYAFTKMIRTAQVQDLLKYSGRDDPKNLGMIDGLKQLLGLEHILVGNGMKNSAKPGATATFARHWDPTKAMVARIATGPEVRDLSSQFPSLGRTITWGGDGAPIAMSAMPGAAGQDAMVLVEEYREEARRGGVIRARNDRVIKRMYVQTGHLLNAVTA